MKLKDRDIQLLQNLMRIPSPSGFEKNLVDWIKNYLLTVCNNTIDFEIDSKYNFIVKIEGKDKTKTIMVDAHIDEIGFVINNINKEGLLSLQYIGGGDVSILSARHLNICTNGEIINCVVNRRHSHLIENEEYEMLRNISEAEIDVGTRNRSEIIKRIKIGDPVVYQSEFKQLIEDYYTGYGFDDKAGAFILIQAIEEIINNAIVPSFNTIFLFSVQEEIGQANIKRLIQKYNPNVFIGLDVTFATDYLYEENLEREVGHCNLGEGIVLYRGTSSDELLNKQIEKIAKKYKLPLQYQADNGEANTNAMAVVNECDNLKIINLGIPLRNMHCPVEIINLQDLKDGVKLIKEFISKKDLKI